MPSPEGQFDRRFDGQRDGQIDGQNVGPTDEQITRDEFRTGSKLFLPFGLAAGGLYVFAPEGPFRWLLLAIAVVCLTRSMWYYARWRSSPEPPPPSPDERAP